MKIAIISSVFIPVKCGLSNAVYNLTKNFIKQGHDLTVIIPYHPAHKKFPLKERIDGVIVVRFLFPIQGFYRRQAPSGLFRWIYVREMCVSPIVLLKLIKLLKKEKFDIVNMQFVGCYTPFVLIAKIFVKFKLVVTLQGYSSHIFRFGDWFNRWIFKKVLKKADFLTAISEYVLDEASKIEPCVRYKSTLIPNGINFSELESKGLDEKRYLSSVQRPPNEFTPIGGKRNTKIEEPFVLSIGSLWKCNGFDLLITAFKDVLEKGHRCQLVIIGDGYQRRYLENLAVLLGIDNMVHFFSGLHKDQVDRLVQQSLFYIRTPRIDPIGEIYPRVLERGKPILSTDMGCWDNFAKNGILVKRNIGNISDGIIAMLNNDKGGIEPEENREKSHKPYIFSLGRFEQYKQFDILIRAFKNVVEMGFDVYLLIGGEGRELNYYQKLVSSLDLEEKVYFLGFLDRGRVMKFYHRCLFFVAPFENEPFGVAALEAMAVGKPVIVSRAGAMPELIKDGSNGIMVEPDSEVALASAIGRLLKDKKLRDRLGSKARLSVEKKYSWDNISENYLSKFRNLNKGVLDGN